MYQRIKNVFTSFQKLLRLRAFWLLWLLSKFIPQTKLIPKTKFFSRTNSLKGSPIMLLFGQIQFTSSQVTINEVVNTCRQFAYCYHSVNASSSSLSQWNHIHKVASNETNLKALSSWSKIRFAPLIDSRTIMFVSRH